MNTSPFPLHLIGIDLKALAPALIRKLKTYVELFNTMEQHGGWLPYPLLWILFKDLRSMRCFGRQVKNRDVLELYNKGVGATSRFAVHDLLTIQRQRRCFIRLNPL